MFKCRPKYKFIWNYKKLRNKTTMDRKRKGKQKYNIENVFKTQIRNTFC